MTEGPLSSGGGTEVCFSSEGVLWGSLAHPEQRRLASPSPWLVRLRASRTCGKREALSLQSSRGRRVAWRQLLLSWELVLCAGEGF